MVELSDFPHEFVGLAENTTLLGCQLLQTVDLGELQPSVGRSPVIFAFDRSPQLQRLPKQLTRIGEVVMVLRCSGRGSQDFD